MIEALTTAWGDGPRALSAATSKVLTREPQAHALTRGLTALLGRDGGALGAVMGAMGVDVRSSLHGDQVIRADAVAHAADVVQHGARRDGAIDMSPGYAMSVAAIELCVARWRDRARPVPAAVRARRLDPDLEGSRKDADDHAFR